MKNFILAGILTLVLSAGVSAADTVKVVYSPEWYASHYPYMTYTGEGFTFESEFLWPTGYHRLDSASLSPFQFWVSNIPLWHSMRPVGSPSFGKVLPPEKISRPVHYVWKTIRFFDCVIPLQLALDYRLYFEKKQLDKLPFALKAGAPITYKQFLRNSVQYDSRGAIVWVPAKERKASDTALSEFMELVAINTSYGSMIANCEPIADSLLLPGDLYVSSDPSGMTGKVYVVLVVVVNSAGERKYIVATGCDQGCDFYIPLFGEDRSYPWISYEQIRQLGKFPVNGFYRLKGTGLEKKK